MGRILVVEDDTAVGAAVGMLLELESHLVTVAHTGEAALHALETSPMDLAVLDLELSGMDGLAVLQSMRRSAPELPIVVISGVLSRDGRTIGDDTVAVAQELGAVAAVRKPFKAEALLDAVETGLARRGSDRS